MRLLCVAEKPSIAKAIAGHLSNNTHQSRRGKNKYCMNYDFQHRLGGQQCQVTVTSVLGHLTSVDFTAQHQKWQSCSPLELFTAPIETRVGDQQYDVAKNLEQECRTTDWLVIWTDCDREGENIGWEIAQVCQRINRCLQVKRARFSVVQRQEILKAFNQLQQLDYRQAEAVNARIELDLRIGAAFTRFQTLQFGPRFAELDQRIVSYGSCQFPAFGFVVEQYWRRENFQPEKFWYIDTVLKKNGKQCKFSWRTGRVFDEDICAVLHEHCKSSNMATVETVTKKPTRKWRPLPLTTVELQKFGASVLKINSHKMMQVAEDLYNKGFISYPRTETDQFDDGFELKELIQKQQQDPKWGYYANLLLQDQPQKFKWPRKGQHNDKAHPPIHPVKPAQGLGADAARVYEFVTRRFLACCSEDAIGSLSSVTVRIAQQLFDISGLQVLDRNFLDVYVYEKWADYELPDFHQGEQIKPLSIDMHSGTTSPPQLLTEAELIAVMDRNGIGTDATIAEHIKKIQDREYVFLDGQYFVPSTLGLALVEGYDAIGFEQSLAKPQLRRQMEQRMIDICEGRVTRQIVVSESVALYREMFVKAMEQSDKISRALAKHFETDPDGNLGQVPHQHQQLHGTQNNLQDENAVVMQSVTTNYNGTSSTDATETQLSQIPSHIDSETSTVPKCTCDMRCVLRTVTKDSVNKGRKFFVCATRSCQFFEWVEDPGLSMQPVNNAQSTIKYQLPAQPSFVPPSYYEQSMTAPIDPSKPKCHCNLHCKVVTVHKAGPNKDKQFWSCSKMTSQCNFFQWCEQSTTGQGTVNGGFSKNMAPQSITCFKCNQPGHYASHCSSNQPTAKERSKPRRKSAQRKSPSKKSRAAKQK